MYALTKEASMSILILYNNLSSDQREVWRTAAEIRNLLVFGGVGRALTEEHVVHAKMRCDKPDTFLKRRRDAKISYYRSPAFEDKCPDDQRWKDSGLPDRKIAKSIMPPSVRNYFNENKTTRRHLSILNDALIIFQNTKDDKEQQQKKKKKKKGGNTHTTPATLGNTRATTDIGAAHTTPTQPLLKKKVVPPSQRWDIANGKDDSATVGVKRHGESIERCDVNELPTDGQLWLRILRFVASTCWVLIDWSA